MECKTRASLKDKGKVIGSFGSYQNGGDNSSQCEFAKKSKEAKALNLQIAPLGHKSGLYILNIGGIIQVYKRT